MLTGIISAQAEKPLVEEWIQNDIEATKLILKLSRNLPQDPNEIAELIGSRASQSPEELGFGAKKIEESQGYGYTSITVSAFIFKDSVIRYRITLGNSLSWTRIRERIIKAWKENAQILFKEYESGIYYEIKNDAALGEYKRAVAKELGEVKPVKVSAELKENYEYLISPLENSTVGLHPCGVAGVVPTGKDAIDLITESKRTDLLENILRGYNPGGRVYAAIAFSEMKKRGRKLNSETEKTLQKVINFDLPIDVCLGGTIFNKTTGEILREFNLL